MMHIIRILSIVFLLLSLSFARDAVLLDGTAAVVGDEVILKSDLDAYTALRLEALGITPGPQKLHSLRKQYLNEMIDGKVLLVYAKNDSTLSVTDEEVNRALDNHIAMILQQNRLSIDSLDHLLQQEQGMTLAKFKDETRKGIREQLLKQKVQQTHLSSVKVSRRDVEEFYAQYRDSLPKAGESVLLSRLSIEAAPPAQVRQAAYDKILKAKARLSKGDAFAGVAAELSESPDAAEGGDLGYIEKGSTSLLSFEEVAFSLRVGETSEPFETQLGFHILKVSDRRNRQVHVHQIFVSVAPPPEQIAEITSRLDSIRTSVKTSAGFAAAVRKWSTDSPSKIRDGRLGWKSLVELPAPLRASVDTLQSGAITPILRQDNELSLYRIDDRAQQRTLTLEDDWPILADKARDIATQKKLIELVERWRAKIFISERL